MKRALLLLAALALAGCSTTKVMTGVMSSWEGATVDQVIAQWGYPHGELKVAGKTILYWDRNVSVAMPMMANTTATANRIGSTTYVQGTTTYSGGGTFQGGCRRMLEINPQNVVIAWQWEGNNCPFGEMGPYADWRRH